MMSIRFSWIGLIVAPLLVPAVFSAAMAGLSANSVAGGLLMFVFLLVVSSIVSYGTMIVLFLPLLYLLSLCRPLTGFRVCLAGLVLGALVFFPMTWMDWKSSGPDSGPPEESFFEFLLRWAADPFQAIYPLAGLITAGAYWWLGSRRWGRSGRT